MAYHALVIEDDRGTSEIFEQVLVSLGLTVTCARNGATALERLQRQAYDVVFLDLLLPRISGLELLKQRDTIAHFDCPVVVVTAHKRMRETLPLGPRDHFLLKPVQVRDLTEIISHVIPDCAPADP